jgi:hypothetical protein
MFVPVWAHAPPQILSAIHALTPKTAVHRAPRTHAPQIASARNEIISSCSLPRAAASFSRLMGASGCPAEQAARPATVCLEMIKNPQLLGG